MLPSEEECIKCEEATYVEDGTDVYCPNCYYVKRSQTGIVDEVVDPWQQFWRHRRANYDGFHGPERAKMVGGFAKGY